MVFDSQTLNPGPLQDLYKYWSAKRDGDAIPAWDDIYLTDLGPLVPQITVFDVDVENRDAQIRFVGTNIIDSQGSDTTGSQLSQMENMSNVLNRCLNVVETHEPYYIANQPVMWTNNNFKSYSTLGLPLSNEDGIVDKIIYLMIFE